MMKFFLVLIPYLVSLFIIAILLRDNLKLVLETKEKEETIQILKENIDALSKELKEKQNYLEPNLKEDFEGVPV